MPINTVRPSERLAWTQGNPGVQTEPTDPQKFGGFVPNFRPPSQWHNWMFGNVSDWIDYLDYITNSVANLTVSNVGHNIATALNLQGQLDQLDAYLSQLGFKQAIPTGVVNGINDTFILPFQPLSQDSMIAFTDNIDVETTEFVLTTSGGQPAIRYIGAAIPSGGQTPYVIALTSDGAIGNIGSAGAWIPYGTTGAPLVITTNIAISSDQRQMRFVKSSGGQFTVAGPNQIAVSTKVGQEIMLIGTSNADYLTINDGNGLSLSAAFNIKQNSNIVLVWNGTVWVENSRKA